MYKAALMCFVFYSFEEPVLRYNNFIVKIAFKGLLDIKIIMKRLND